MSYVIVMNTDHRTPHKTEMNAEMISHSQNFLDHMLIFHVRQ